MLPWTPQGARRYVIPWPVSFKRRDHQILMQISFTNGSCCQGLSRKIRFRVIT